MIPFFVQPSVDLGPFTVHAFGLIVAAAVLTGLSVGARRFRSEGLDAALGERLAGWAIVGGLLGAHLFSVLFYFPHKLAENPLLLLKFWEDISSFGSMLGGALAIALFLRIHGPREARSASWAYFDVAAYAFPISLMIGRLACTLAHDHPGRLTRFPLAVSLRSEEARAYITAVYTAAGRAGELPPAGQLARMGFHDLGWYEFLYLATVVVPVILWVGRRRRTPGVFLALFVALYLPVRILLDFLRVADARYAGLTPAQWVAALALLALPALVLAIRRAGPLAGDLSGRGVHEPSEAGSGPTGAGAGLPER
jgi:phosphatidylglycerol:prolipoprotein diacylglycerol transferase